MSTGFFSSSFERGVEPVIDRFLDPRQDTTTLDEATMRAVHSGHPNAFLMPAVDMATRAALSVCSLPEVRRIIPNEIQERARYAGSIAAEVVLRPYQEERGWIARHYMDSPILREGTSDRQMLLSLSDPDTLSALSFAPFADASYVAGGAKRRLDIDGLPTNQASIVGNSPSLLLFAQIDAESTREDAENLLGWPPYVHADSLIVRHTVGHLPTVNFTQDAEVGLRGLMSQGGGCPAANAPSESDAGTNVGLLRESWMHITEFLLSAGAVASL
jgi:hypothetical protein